MVRPTFCAAWIDRYRRLPELIRLLATAALGVPLALVTYEIIYALNPIEPRASVSWLIAYLLGIARQHALHRWLTFQDRRGYWSSLGRAYFAELFLGTVSTAANWWLTEVLDMHHRAVWAFCLLLVASLNLVLLRRFVFRGSSG